MFEQLYFMCQKNNFCFCICFPFCSTSCLLSVLPRVPRITELVEGIIYIYELYICTYIPIYAYIFVYTHMNLLKWLRGCSPANLTMVSCELRKFIYSVVAQSTSLNVSVGLLCMLESQRSRPVKNEFLGWWGQTDKDQKLPSLMSLHRFPGEDLAQTKGIFSHLNTQMKSLD